MKTAIKAFFRGICQKLDLYIVRSRAVWTDDPKYDVVCLRNKIIALVDDRIGEVTGVTEPEEFYLLAPGDNRYALARIRGGLIIEGTYFQRGWLDNLKTASLDVSITPRILEIRGKPYKITKTANPQLAQLSLKTES
ncbi:MAG TPA: hypothetical protein VMM84_18310 [Pyrinomonadaceae bacterium]|nr:hypothetical protein [Pyrinomonadaceae bacterium]